MDRFQYEILGWLELSGPDRQAASSWYREAGWYMNEREASGEVTSVRFIAPARTDSAAGAIGALNACGDEGWEVAAYIPGSPASPPSRKLFGVDDEPARAYFLLRRRVGP
jgi:hypothetical protein